MGKILPPIIINRFDGGISDDPRQPIANMGAMVKHFNIFDNPFKLTPYRSTEADTATNVSSTDAKTYDIRNFQLGSNGQLYGLGKNANGYPKVLKKTDPTTGNWLSSNGGNAATAEGEGTAARIVGCFIEWQSAFWFFQGTDVFKVLISNGVSSDQGNIGATPTTVAQGIVGADNNLYLPYNNKLVRVNSSGTVTDDVSPAIPSDMRITSVTRYTGGYLAIGCAYGTSATATPAGRSQVFIWDMVSTTFSDVVDWGEGALMCLGNVEGRVVGITDKYITSALGLTRGSMVVRMWAGGIPQVVKEIVTNQTVSTTTQARILNEVVIKNNKMYWVASVPFNQSTTTQSTHHLGIWVFGRKNNNSNFTISLDYIEEGIDTSNFFIRSFGAAGDYWFINHSADGSITKTDDTANYTFTSIYESQIFNLGDNSILKKIIGITVNTAPMPTAGQVVLKYRKDEETSYTTIFTHTTDNSLTHSAVNIESSGATLPTFRELQLRIESVGGAEIVAYSFKCEEVGTKLY